MDVVLFVTVKLIAQGEMLYKQTPKKSTYVSASVWVP